MSKMDDLRALREARYDRAMARAAVNTVPNRPATKPAEAEPPATDLDVKLCGHRAIGGRTCTREHGHAAKSHRYS
jgi:hypothetical protein